jgi:hypothetical protein
MPGARMALCDSKLLQGSASRANAWLRVRDYSSELFGLLLIFSAGLARRKTKQEIVGYYPDVCNAFVNRKQLQTTPLNHTSRISVINLDDLKKSLSCIDPTKALLVTANFGEPVLFAEAFGRGGIPLAVVYRTITSRQQIALGKAGVKLLDVGSRRTAWGIFRELDLLRKRGYFACIVADVPYASCSRVNFLGYQIPISRLPSVYANRCSAAIHALTSNVVSPREMQGNLCALPDCEQASIVAMLERMILADPVQYRWTRSAIIFADPEASKEAMSFTKDVLQFRDRFLANDS